MSEWKNPRPRDCPNDYSCRFTLDSSNGGGDSFEGKVSELTSSGIKRGSCGPLGPGHGVPSAPDPWIIPPRTTNSILLSLWFFREPWDRARRWGCNLCSEPTGRDIVGIFILPDALELFDFFPPFFPLFLFLFLFLSLFIDSFSQRVLYFRPLYSLGRKSMR